MDDSSERNLPNSGVERRSMSPEARLRFLLRNPDVLKMSPDEFVAKSPGTNFAKLIDPPLPEPAVQKWAEATQKLLSNPDEIERCMRLHRTGKDLELGLKWLAIKKYKGEKYRAELKAQAEKASESE